MIRGSRGAGDAPERLHGHTAAATVAANFPALSPRVAGWILALFTVGILVWSAEALACPGCQNPTLPMARTSGVYLAPGGLRLGVGLAATTIEVVHDAGCRDIANCEETPVQPLHNHEQLLVPAQLIGSVEWGLTDNLGLEASVPLRLVYTSVHYTRPDGSDYTPLDEGVHHRNEMLVGVGDPVVTLRAAYVLDGWWLIGRIGASLPLGRTEPDPFEAGDAGEEHQHIQFGTGTFDPILGVELARSFGRLQVAGYGQLSLPLYANSHGFQAGSRALVGVQTGWRFAERAVVQGSVEGLREGPERWGGTIQQDGLLGRQELLVGAQLVFSLGGPQYSVGVRAPVVREIFVGDESETGDITAPVSLSVGAQWSL